MESSSSSSALNLPISATIIGLYWLSLPQKYKAPAIFDNFRYTKCLRTAGVNSTGKDDFLHLVVYFIDYIVFDILNLLACKNLSLFSLSNQGSIVIFYLTSSCYSSLRTLFSNGVNCYPP